MNSKSIIERITIEANKVSPKEYKPLSFKDYYQFFKDGMDDKQKINSEKFKDIFEKLDEIIRLEYTNEDEIYGAMKSCTLIHSYLINREI